MAETSSRAAAAASPGRDGGGRDGCGRGKRRSASQSPRKRRKIEAEAEVSAPKVKLAAEKRSSGPSDANKTAGWLLQKPQGWVVERTAAVIRNAQAIFPAARDTPVLYRNQFLDLWACGRALEDPWNEKWQHVPLVLQDFDLADAVQIKLPGAEEAAEDMTTTITKVLKNHPGPIKLFRLDHTACPWEGLLCEWVEVLSAKGVQELVLLNLRSLRTWSSPCTASAVRA